MRLLLLLALPARAELPLPAFPDCAEDALDQCPNDLDEGDWDQISWVPAASKDSVRAAELEMGSGIAADVAFRHSTGRWDVPIAIVDTGIEWQSGSIARKILLNTAELPLPQDASGAEHGTYDLDGNGLVNVSDYADDPRVAIAAGVDAADGILDGSDLIHTFSDGVDDDGNGFTDDIAGWDFFEWDNDPYADLDGLYASHGTGVMREAAEEGGDGGSIGICPNCAILPLRTGEGIITDGDRVGLAITYATDRGAKSVGMALGALSHSEITEAAIHYADANGVVLVAAAGDENSFHHNFPSVNAPILYVHSVRADNGDEGGPEVYSYLSFFNCNNYGPRTDLIAPSHGCATGSVARISGAVGLLLSAARDQGLELTADEVRSLLKSTADDVHFTDEDIAVIRTYPAQEGWDAFYGYGRANVGRAVEAVVAGELPPTARITSPEWFDWADGTVAIEGRVASRSAVASWTVEVGRGAEPTSWTPLATGTSATDGVLAELDATAFGDVTFDDLGAETVVERMHRAHEPLVTVRLTVTDDAGRTSADRRGIWVHDDPDRLDGFPYRLLGSGEASPVLADLDGDGVLEIVAASGSGLVHAVRGDGTPVPGFPVRTSTIPQLADYASLVGFASGDVPADASEGIIATPAVGDLDGDGVPEIVAAGLRGGVYAWHADGSVVSGFPVRITGRTPDEQGGGNSFDTGVGAAPALGDVDGDGDLEIVVGGLDQRLYVWDAGGALLDGYPLEVCRPDLCGLKGARIVSSPALGDVDGDGDLDAVLGTNEVPPGAAGLLYAVDLTRAAIWDGWPIEGEGLINQGVLPVIGEGTPSSVALADLDGDGDLEIAWTAMLGSPDPIHHDGSVAVDVGWVRDDYGANTNLYTENAFVTMVTNPAFGDLDGDEVPDFTMGGVGPMFLVSLAGTRVFEYQHGIGAWSGATGAAFAGFPRAVDDVAFLNAPAMADLTGDERPEVIYGSGGGLLYAWDADGAIAPGWPKFLGGWMLGGAAVGDVDGDGYVDVVAGTREGWLFAWRSQGPADQQVQWAGMRHDAMNTGNWHTALPEQDGPRRGCCNKRKRATEGAAAFLFLIPLLGARRRRS